MAEPCLEIEKDPSKAYDYTNKGNLVAVITNGTAVLGLGDIGPLASKPVMEGKAVLFKKFADVDSIDLVVDEKDPKKFISIVKTLGGSFGGINLEDIKAPDCFEIEETLKKEMDIPVFHDDQHGTAIVVLAGLQNACHISGKKLEDIKVVVNGAGSAGIACLTLMESAGVRLENIILLDTKGVVYEGRTEGMNKYKEHFANKTEARTLQEATKGADVLIGLSKGGLFDDEEILTNLNKDPIIFALANPSPEITPARAQELRPDAILATGRSDYPNQINNVLCFPYIFRAALDCRSTEIND